ncbi:MAG TPA: hypothetical protein VMS63_01575 [Gaiellaceae bacterium]|nr:hypothetical protein [Gaiellaceae bacterium]
MPERLDRLLVLAAAALLIAISWDALAHRRPAARPVATPAARPPPEAPVPERIRLVPSSTAFLPTCPARDLHLSVGPGRALTLRFAGTRCHVPPLHLRAVVRDATGAVAYRGPAMAHEDLSGNYAGEGIAHARLLAPCGDVTVSGSGLSAGGTTRCP